MVTDKVYFSMEKGKKNRSDIKWHRLVSRQKIDNLGQGSVHKNNGHNFQTTNFTLIFYIHEYRRVEERFKTGLEPYL